MSNERIITLAGLAAVVLLLLGTFYLFVLRFQAGDIYPAYSSLRSDPLGTKVFYESLMKCELVSVSRNYMSPEKVDLSSGTTLLFLGDSIPGSSRKPAVNSALAGSINSSLRRGARLVITFMPQNATSAKTVSDKDESDKKLRPEKAREQTSKDDARTKKDIGDKHGEKEDEELPDRSITLCDWLGIDTASRPVYGASVATLAPGMKSSGLPPSITCHTSLCFTNLDERWNVVYQRGDKPVVIERSFGKGAIVISTLTYFVSNEAMRYERHPALLSWLIGTSHNVVFDEYHLGMGEQQNTAKLMRKYGLHWFVAGLLLLAGLFIWQNSLSLVPPHKNTPTGDKGAEAAAGKDSTAGLINLLRRNIPASAILGICVDEWKKTASSHTSETERKIAEVQILAVREEGTDFAQRHLVKTYNDMCKILKKQ